MRRSILNAACLLPLLATALWAAEPRFVGALRDGTRIDGADVSSWHKIDGDPKLGDRRLLDPGNPYRWLEDTTLTPAEGNDALLEMATGDTIPGRVVGFVSGSDEATAIDPPHLLVEPSVELHTPYLRDDEPRPPVRVITTWLRRVVFKPGSGRTFVPDTVLLDDGRQLAFRSLRWTDDGVRLLRDQGIEAIPYHRLAEVRFKIGDPWQAYFEQLSLLCPDATGEVIQLETSDGVRLTASTSRFEAISHGNAGQPERWLHIFQPAWSLDPLFVRFRTIRVRRQFIPREVPLTLIAPSRIAQQPVLAGGWTWQVDRNVQSGPLRSGGQAFGYGFGVQAHCELDFPLPPGAKTFRTQAGIDALAGSGGCVRLAVQAGGSNQPLFASDVLVGSEQVVDSGRIALPAETRSLRLIADPVLDNRPAGADPLDIRDSVDWLEPLVELDQEMLQSALRHESPRRIAAWQDWQVQDPGGGPVSIGGQWDLDRGHPPRYYVNVAARERFLTLSRKIQVGPEQKVLVLAVSRPMNQKDPSRLQVNINGEPAATLEAPERRPNEWPDPLLVSLAEHQGKQVEITIRQLADGDDSRVEWTGLGFSSRPPGLLTLFEDDAALLEQLTTGEGVAALEREAPYSGSACIKLTPDARGNAQMTGLDAPIRSRPKPGEYRYIRFVWRRPNSGRICLQLAADGEFGPVEPRRGARSLRYDVGSGNPSHGTAKRISGRVPEEWDVVTRDLAGDFGEFTLTGLSLSAPDGPHVLFDHIYLGRTKEDFDRIEVEVHGK